MAHWQQVIFGDESRFHLYLLDGRLGVCRFAGEHFQQRCQSDRFQTGTGSVHVWRAFHSGAKSPPVLPVRYLTGELYRGILWNSVVPFARQHFGDNYRYQDDSATPHHAQVVLDFLQQGNITKIEQPARSPSCNPTEHIWDELGRAITSMDNPPQNLSGVRQALLGKWAEIPVERLQRLVASMPRRLVAIITTRGGNTRYWPSIHKTTPTGSKKSSSCDQIYHNHHLMTFRYAHAANFAIINEWHHKFTKIHTKQKVHTIHRKNINPANQHIFRPCKQIEYEYSSKRYIIPGCNNFVIILPWSQLLRNV